MLPAGSGPRLLRLPACTLPIGRACLCGMWTLLAEAALWKGSSPRSQNNGVAFCLSKALHEHRVWDVWGVRVHCAGALGSREPGAFVGEWLNLYHALAKPERDVLPLRSLSGGTPGGVALEVASWRRSLEGSVDRGSRGLVPRWLWPVHLRARCDGATRGRGVYTAPCASLTHRECDVIRRVACHRCELCVWSRGPHAPLERARARGDDSFCFACYGHPSLGCSWYSACFLPVANRPDRLRSLLLQQNCWSGRVSA